MPRLIDAEKLAEYKANGISNLTEWQKGWNDAIDTIIEEAPTIDAEPVRHGHWVGKPIAGYATVRCSVCGDVFRENTGRWNYCPNCRAKMDERREDG